MLDPIQSEPAPSKPTAKKATKRKDRFAEINAFVDVTMWDLTRAELCVWLILWRDWLILWRDKKPDGLVKTSQADLARRGGMSLRAAKQAVRKLEALQLLRVVRKGGIGRGPNTYQIRGNVG